MCYTLLAAFFISTVTQSYIERQKKQTRKILQAELALVRSNIEAVIFRDTYLADSLATVVSIDSSFAISNWDAIAAKLLAKAKFVRNVGLAPSDVISHVYPLDGNEKAVGFDLRTDPIQYQTVQIARERQEIFMAGPLELVQGGTALIARYPIFSDAPYNTKYWGGVSIVLDYNQIIENSGFFDIEGLDVTLVSINNNGYGRKILLGDESTIEKADINYPVYLPNGRWELFGVYSNLYNSPYLIGLRKFFLFSGIVIAICGYFLLLLLFRSYVQLHKASFLDELTQLPNRRFLLNELDRLMSIKSEDVEFTILNIDLNGFKQVNDSLGHEAGDQLLKHISDGLRRCLRSSDLIARVGGDEFVVVLHRITKVSDVEFIIHKVHNSLERAHFYFENHMVTPSLSIGHYSFKGKGNPLMIKEILKQADQSMYKDKIARKSIDYS
jgi:diguanylate cyclase (GGDEF)-like protein